LANEFDCTIEELVYSKLDLIARNAINKSSINTHLDHELIEDASKFIVEFLLQKSISLALTAKTYRSDVESIEIEKSKKTFFDDFSAKTSMALSNLDLILECLKGIYIHEFTENNITIDQKFIEWKILQ